MKKTVSMNLDINVGEISAEFLLVYPPGIPIFCPGEVITQEIVNCVKMLKIAKLSVQGTEDPEVNFIKVVKEENLLFIK
ncbi:MAG: arginine/lysine/ornithine decarboxylase [Haloplasmataceae bacterium]|jgi:lysine decarboxylase|nr:arginine/lysine/ornithine decarboxylase [Haloplasmataceae bacterium]